MTVLISNCPKTTAEGRESVAVPLVLGSGLAEPLRVELLWLSTQLRQPVIHARPGRDVSARR